MDHEIKSNSKEMFWNSSTFKREANFVKEGDAGRSWEAFEPGKKFDKQISSFDTFGIRRHEEFGMLFRRAGGHSESIGFGEFGGSGGNGFGQLGESRSTSSSQNGVKSVAIRSLSGKFGM